ncbi:hypothetical protein E4T56_gene3547 [Termitomyces sp. T112]|nr:hypothetical protein C0989_005165 [Termitomyces sp. Mn162]KAG5731603.1 hypothetical protein E4T56_gene3547 [Termitomyces sp. T112]
MNFALAPDSSNQPEKVLHPQTFSSNELSINESLWSKHYQFLSEHGYTLRNRYRPGWKASWLSGLRKISECEDAVLLLPGHTIDATRSDGMLVALKKINLRSNYTEEIEIGKLFSSLELRQDPRNHCVPILDVLYPPGETGLAFIVMPLLYTTQLAPFETLGEVIEYIRQILEGIHFMHENNVAHGHVILNLLLLQPPNANFCLQIVIPSMTLDYSGKVSQPDTRTDKPVKYYLVGFHKSINYHNQDSQEKEWVDKPSKYQFAADIYYLGNMLSMHFLDGGRNMGFNIAPKQGFEFMRKLISDMMNGDPDRRPDMGEVVARFNSLVDGLNNIQLRSPVISAGETLGIYKSMTHWAKQLIYMAQGIPPIPTADF